MNLQNKRKAAIGIFLLSSLLSCGAPPDEKLPTDTPSTTAAKSPESPTAETDQSWVIITKEQAEEMGIASWLAESDGLWTPSEEHIFTLEEKLPEYLSQNAYLFNRQPPAWERLDEYQRQYIGLQRGGKQIIYGNYFCDNLGIDWRQKLVIVEDGGDCFFLIEYDLEDSSFILLMVNGES